MKVMVDTLKAQVILLSTASPELSKPLFAFLPIWVNNVSKYMQQVTLAPLKICSRWHFQSDLVYPCKKKLYKTWYLNHVNDLLAGDSHDVSRTIFSLITSNFVVCSGLEGGFMDQTET